MAIKNSWKLQDRSLRCWRSSRIAWASPVNHLRQEKVLGLISRNLLPPWHTVVAWRLSSPGVCKTIAGSWPLTLSSQITFRCPCGRREEQAEYSAGGESFQSLRASVLAGAKNSVDIGKLLRPVSKRLVACVVAWRWMVAGATQCEWWG